MPGSSVGDHRSDLVRLGQMSARNTGRPWVPMPSGSVVRSVDPAGEREGDHSGGEVRQLARASG
jgi:hypothetical protein